MVVEGGAGVSGGKRFCGGRARVVAGARAAQATRCMRGAGHLRPRAAAAMRLACGSPKACMHDWGIEGAALGGQAPRCGRR